jgi:hypothetical protein
VAHVGRHRVDRPLVAVEAEHVVPPAIVAPEHVIEPVAQDVGLPAEPVGERPVAHQPLGELGDAELGVEHVALELAGRDRQVRDPAVGELHTVPRVLPALVAEPL